MVEVILGHLLYEVGMFICITAGSFVGLWLADKKGWLK